MYEILRFSPVLCERAVPGVGNAEVEGVVNSEIACEISVENLDGISGFNLALVEAEEEAATEET
jgi:hypothetical protein